MKVFFKNKKILLFSPNFFGYGQAIADKMRAYGAAVDYFDERPGNDFMTKALIRIDKSLLARKIGKYYSRILASLRKDYYDYVLFLNLEAISEKDLLELKKNQPHAVFIIYMWDSIKNKKHTVSLLPHFDLKRTFDKNDSENYVGLNFRPLFFLDRYKNLKDDTTKDIDLLFVGTIHSDRYKILVELRDLCNKIGKTTDFFMFLQSKKLFYAQKASNRFFSNAKISDFEFNPLPKNDLLQKLERTNVVLDIQHPDQTGLTMRTIEMIGAKKKLITTNQHIRDYDFYMAANILCIDRDNIDLNVEFFDTLYEDLDITVYHKYSIEGWLEDVFSIPFNI